MREAKPPPSGLAFSEKNPGARSDLMREAEDVQAEAKFRANPESFLRLSHLPHYIEQWVFPNSCPSPPRKHRIMSNSQAKGEKGASSPMRTGGAILCVALILPELI